MPTPYTGGVTVTFNGQSIASEITRITANAVKSDSNRPRVSTAHLGSPMTAQQGTAVIRLEEPYVNIWKAPAGSAGSSLDIDYIGSGGLAGGSTGEFSVSGPFSISATVATVATSVVTGAVGDLVRGSIRIVW